MIWAKIFFYTVPGRGTYQLLVTTGTSDDDMPAIQFATNGELFVEFGISYEDTDAGWAERDQRFSEMDENIARPAFDALLGQIDAFRGESR